MTSSTGIGAGTVTAPRRSLGRDAGASFATVLAGAGTRIAALAVVLLVLAGSGHTAETVVVAVAMAVPYAATRLALPGWIGHTGSRQLAAMADLVTTATLIGVASGYRHGVVLVAILAAVAGAARGIGDVAHELSDSGPKVAGSGMTSAAISAGATSVIVPICAGILAGAVVGWLGIVSVVWLAAIAFATTAALTAWTMPPTSAGPADAATADAVALALNHDTEELRIYRPFSGRRVGLRTAVITAAVHNAGLAGALAIVMLWTHGVLQPTSGQMSAVLGLVGGAFVVGAFAGSAAAYGMPHAASNIAAGQTGTDQTGTGQTGTDQSSVGKNSQSASGVWQIGWAAAIGFAIGATPNLILAHLPGLTAVIAAAALVAGVVFTVKPPPDEVIVDYAGVPQEPVIAENLAVAGAFVVLPVAAWVGAVLALHLSVVVGLLLAGVLYLIAVGVPLLRREAPGAEVAAAEVVVEPVAARFAGVATWVAVTLIYAEGGWTVEVERKEGVGEGGHEVKSTDALRAIDILDLPGLREEIEEAIADDQTRAEHETQRLRDELGDVDERLAAIREMVEWSASWRADR